MNGRIKCNHTNSISKVKRPALKFQPQNSLNLWLEWIYLVFPASVFLTSWYLRMYCPIQLSAPPWTVSTRLLCPWNFPAKNTGVGCHFLLQGIFLIQVSNVHLLHLLHWQVDSLPLSPLGSTYLLTVGGICWSIINSIFVMFENRYFNLLSEIIETKPILQYWKSIL